MKTQLSPLRWLALSGLALCTTAMAQTSPGHSLPVGKTLTLGSGKPMTSLKVAVASTPMTISTTRLPDSVGTRILVSAAGSLLLLADGVVAHADLVQVLPPAPGFVYER